MALVPDLYSPRIVGWSMHASMTSQTATVFHARFSLAGNDASLMRLYDPWEGTGHLVCAAAHADSALALVIEAPAVGALSEGETTRKKLPRIIAGWSPLLEVVLRVRSNATSWLYCSTPGHVQVVQYNDVSGHALLSPTVRRFAQLQRQAPALATGLLWAIQEGAPVQRHAVQPAFPQ